LLVFSLLFHGRSEVQTSDGQDWWADRVGTGRKWRPCVKTACYWNGAGSRIGYPCAATDNPGKSCHPGSSGRTAPGVGNRNGCPGTVVAAFFSGLEKQRSSFDLRYHLRWPFPAHFSFIPAATWNGQPVICNTREHFPSHVSGNRGR
jgi:hypothetical protein